MDDDGFLTFLDAHQYNDELLEYLEIPESRVRIFDRLADRYFRWLQDQEYGNLHRQDEGMARQQNAAYFAQQFGEDVDPEIGANPRARDPIPCKRFKEISLKGSYAGIDEFRRVREEDAPWLIMDDDIGDQAIAEVYDAAFTLDEPYGYEYLADPRTREIVIMAPRDPGQQWKGTTYTAEELRDIISDTSNVFIECHEDSDGIRGYEKYVPGQPMSALYVKVHVNGIPYYVPYIDFEAICESGKPETYLLKKTRKVLQYIASFAVANGASHISAEHCMNELNIEVYRMVPVDRRSM